MTQTKFSLSRRILFLCVLTFAFPIIAMPQTDETSGGRKTVRVGDANDFVQAYHNPNPCDVISHNITFCREGTGWMLERAPISNAQALYQLSEGRRAFIKVLWMYDGTSSDLSSAEVEALLDEHIYQNGPRGPFAIETIISEKIAYGGQLIERDSIVKQADGKRYLHMVNVLSLDYGLGFFETTQLLPDSSESPEISDAQLALQSEFMTITRVSIRIRTR